MGAGALLSDVNDSELVGIKMTEDHKRKISEARLRSKKVFRYPREMRVCAAPGCDNEFETSIGGARERRFCCTAHSKIGVPSPLKGRTKETDAGIARAAEKLTGRKSDESANRKRSEALKGRTYVEMFGEEEAERLKKLRSEAMMGENSPSWAGGVWVRSDPYPKEFYDIRPEVRKRDGLKCRICEVSHFDLWGETGRGLDVHHIDYDKQNTDMSNLVSLCRSCHVKTNVNRPFWTGFFQGMMNCIQFMG